MLNFKASKDKMYSWCEIESGVLITNIMNIAIEYKSKKIPTQY